MQDSQEKVFTSAVPFDFVINCAGETRYGLSDAVYNDGIYNLTVSCAQLAAKHDVRRFVEISTGYSTPNSEVNSNYAQSIFIGLASMPSVRCIEIFLGAAP